MFEWNYFLRRFTFLAIFVCSHLFAVSDFTGLYGVVDHDHLLELAKDAFEENYIKTLTEKEDFFADCYNNNLVVTTESDWDFRSNGIIFLRLIDFLEKKEGPDAERMLSHLTQLFYLLFHRHISFLDVPKEKQVEMIRALHTIFNVKNEQEKYLFRGPLTRIFIYTVMVESLGAHYHKKKEALFFAYEDFRSELYKIIESHKVNSDVKLEVDKLINNLGAYGVREPIVKPNSIKRWIIFGLVALIVGGIVVWAMKEIGTWDHFKAMIDDLVASATKKFAETMKKYFADPIVESIVDRSEAMGQNIAKGMADGLAYEDVDAPAVDMEKKRVNPRTKVIGEGIAAGLAEGLAYEDVNAPGVDPKKKRKNRAVEFLGKGLGEDIVSGGAKGVPALVEAAAAPASATVRRVTRAAGVHDLKAGLASVDDRLAETTDRLDDVVDKLVAKVGDLQASVDKILDSKLEVNWSMLKGKGSVKAAQEASAQTAAQKAAQKAAQEAEKAREKAARAAAADQRKAAAQKRAADAKARKAAAEREAEEAKREAAEMDARAEARRRSMGEVPEELDKEELARRAARSKRPVHAASAKKPSSQAGRNDSDSPVPRANQRAKRNPIASKDIAWRSEVPEAEHADYEQYLYEQWLDELDQERDDALNHRREKPARASRAKKKNTEPQREAPKPAAPSHGDVAHEQPEKSGASKSKPVSSGGFTGFINKWFNPFASYKAGDNKADDARARNKEIRAQYDRDCDEAERLGRPVESVPRPVYVAVPH